MTRSELISRLASQFPQFTRSDVEASVKSILDAISDRLGSGGRVEVRGFGSFTVNTRPPRIGRNPKTGKIVSVPEKLAPHFRSGMQLRERVKG